ncbi:putative fimbriae; major subunit [Klebsiella michiganensis]|uniref:Putative fimbriae major subunit n=1 Tax=Klebsiella michiganensis TaxID=1134687 RepID=A0A7H4M6G3_9ENTR|nr:putative fimbriae; major subunit [Klebsiella michiganensis]
MFKKTTLALLTASLFISTSTFAMSNNTITFRGEVSDETCSVAINGNQAKPVVILPTGECQRTGERRRYRGSGDI